MALDIEPDIIIDDGGDFVNILHTTKTHLLDKLIGGCEETTTGIMRLKAMEREGVLKMPMIAVNYAKCKHLFDNRYGTGQSVWDGIMRTTNLVVAGKTVVVAGYGWCGRGVAAKAAGLGANVIVTEIDPVKAIEAYMDGFRVMTMDEAAGLGDVFVTLTGCNDVIVGRHYEKMKNGVLLANAGHFDVEINKPDLLALSVDTFESRDNIMTYVMADCRELNLLAEGRLVNLAAGDGHPAEIMDMSFAIQAKGLEYLALNPKKAPKLYAVPVEIDKEVASLKLASMNLGLDTLTAEQAEYLGI
jgi:adenosylhomocysteinase